MISGLRAAIQTALLAAVWVGCANSQTATGPACTAPGTSAAEPYRWYPALDLARIPFHAAAGPWGPRTPITAPAPPVTQRTVHVTSASQLAAEAMTQGTLIVVAAAYIGPVVLMGNVQDVDIVVPKGRTLAQITVGRYTPPSTTRRFRIRGTTPGEHSGGLVGSITFHSEPAADIIIDGIDLNGADVAGGALLWYFSKAFERVAIVNVRGHTAGPGSLHVRGVDMVIAGNRIMSGARPREVNGRLAMAGWGIRGGDRIVVYDNRIDGNRYHRVRVHPRPGTTQYAWVANNTFVDPHEARIFDAFDVGDGGRYSAVWAICNRVYAHSTCMSSSVQAKNAAYAELTFNTFYGSITEAGQRVWQDREGGGRDYLTGNTYAPWRSPPAWTAPGDPTTTVPLPPVDPNRHDAALATVMKPCPPPPS